MVKGHSVKFIARAKNHNRSFGMARWIVAFVLGVCDAHGPRALPTPIAVRINDAASGSSTATSAMS